MLPTSVPLESVFERNALPMWIYDVETLQILDVNDASVRQYGYSRDEFKTFKVSDVRPPEDTTGFVQHVHESEGTTGVDTGRHIRKDGSIVHVRVTGFPISYGDRRARVALIQDITDRVQAERELRFSHRILEHVGNLVLVTNADAEIIYVSPSVEDILGYRPEEVLGQGWWELTWRGDAIGLKQEKEIIRKLALGETPADPRGVPERKIYHKNGEPRWLLWQHNPVPETREIVGIAHDVTRTRELEKQLQLSQRLEAVGRLSAGVAHDFNNVLTGIMGNAELALLELDDPAAVKSSVEEIRKVAEHAKKVTSQLLAFGRRRHTHLERLDPVQVVRDTEFLLRQALGGDIRLALRLEADTDQVVADSTHISQVLLSLADNAREALTSGGAVVLEVQNRVLSDAEAVHFPEIGGGSYVSIRMSDDGPGIPEDVQERIFEPFFSTKQDDTAPGLGLATVFGLVRQAGGSVGVESEPGGGASFEVLLPVAGEEPGQNGSEDSDEAEVEPLRGDEPEPPGQSSATSGVGA